MNTTVQKWGNSQGIRIPKYILEEVGLNIDDEVKLQKIDNKIVIEKVEKTPEKYPRAYAKIKKSPL